MEYYIYVLAAVGLVYLLTKNRAKPEKYLGKYSIPTIFYWFKYCMFFCLIQLRKRQASSTSDNQVGGYGKKSKSTINDMEECQQLSTHKYAIDAAYFNGYNQNGWYIGAGIQRRHYGKAESLMFIRVPPGIFDDKSDVLEWPWSPATDCDMPNENKWCADSLNYEIVEPMKTWRVTFEGQLKRRAAKTMHQVKFNLEWNATGPYFDFDTDMDIQPTCAAIAREPWSKDFFQRLKDGHQTHYEQFGKLKGKIEIEGLDDQIIEFDSMRDRSYGKYRNWYDFNRYILQYFVLEDGTGIAFHLVNFSILMTHLITGFIVTSDGRKLAITNSDKMLWQIGEQEPPPMSYNVGVTVQGGGKYHLSVKLIETPHYYCGWDWEAKLHSVMTTIQCKLPTGRTISGRGMCEFEYRHTAGRTDGRHPVPAEGMGE